MATEQELKDILGKAQGPVLAVLKEVQREVVGKDGAILRILLAMLAQGHVLLEDIPGVGKTTLAMAFSRALGLSYKRMQFNPDVMPSDITGFSIYDQKTGSFRYQEGAVLCNLFLADEINRAGSRTQAALLEAMEEGAVTVDGITRPIPQPFALIATQNPTGSAGTQLLPDSQLDRFMLRFSLGYPSHDAEVELLRRKNEGNIQRAEQVMDAAALQQAQKQVREVFISQEVYDYIVRLVGATRTYPGLRQGASPRASIALVRLAQATAFLQGRDYVAPKDAALLFQEAVGHRLLLTPAGESRGLTAQGVLEDILQKTPRPRLR